MSEFENLDYYALLGVSRSASLDEIKRAYRREISKFHPDRFTNGTPEEKVYAGERSQRLTEAYRVLSDFADRSAYNRSQPATASASRAQRSTSEPAQPRDHQAELYEQAQRHLADDRLLQGIGVLRQLQQINPFYRDSAEQLAAAEARLNRRQDQKNRRIPRPLLAVGGVIGGLVLAALAAWAIGMRGATASRNPSSTSAPAASIATSLPTQPPTIAPTPVEATPSQAAPTAIAASALTPTTAAVELPTAEPSATPFDFPTITPTTAQTSTGDAGVLLLADTFSEGGWANQRGAGWQVGYQSQRYRISADQGVGTIWSYRTAPAKNVSLGVDMQITAGEGGLLVRFQDASNYVSISLNSSRTSFRVEQHDGGATNVLAGGQSEAIKSGADAVNRLVVQLRGSSMEIVVNGQTLASVDAPGAPDSARYGLLVITNDSAAEAFFDNLEIRRLGS
ncbi:MAG: DnaJ domain-containing protein [Roseiflexaceae bacterium]